MYRPCQGFRQQLVRFIQRSTLYGSWALGVFPFTFNVRTRKWKRSRWLVGYGLIFNVGLIWFVIANDIDTESDVRKEIFERNHLARDISNLHDLLCLLTLIFVHVRNFWLCDDLSSILDGLCDLHYQYFDLQNLEACKNYDSLVMHKALAAVMQFSSMWLMLYIMSTSFGALYMVGAVSLCLAGTGVLFLAMHYHLGVITIYRYIWIINSKLLKLANRLRSGETVDSVEVDLLHFLYNRLLYLNTRLAGIYDFQMILIMVTFLGANIMSIFFIIVFCISLNYTMSISMTLILAHAWFVNFWDCWLSIAVCELAERTGKQTLVILKLFNDNDNVDKDLERSINDFALYCTHQRLRFRLCRMFSVNHETGFHMFMSSALYLLWLIQFDFKNL